ncbi:MAG: cation:proton antiporter [Gammaproteobacteria bacterium]|nr:cation:proton antiporter [Gammaproteobacteria bacterium]
MLGATPIYAWAAGGGETTLVLLWLAVLLLLAKCSSLVEKLGQPAVLGELLIGIALGNLGLVGIGAFEPIKHDALIGFLAELGVVILLFQIGLESEVGAMRRVGWRAFLVACVGVAVPLALGLLAGPLLFPGMNPNVYLFLGATLTATSVGITARVFKDRGALQTAEAQIVLGAAVIDDVIGLILLAVVSAIATTGTVGVGTIAWITAKALLFLGAALIVGQLSAPIISRWFARITTGSGMKFTIAIAFCFVLAYLAQLIGLAPIVGAFAAGLVLDEVIFKDYDGLEVIPDVRRALTDAEPSVRQRVAAVLDNHAKHHLLSLTAPVGHLFIPLFFVYTGMQVDLRTLADLHTLWIALAVTVIAFVGKLVSGLVAGKVNKWVVGWGMAPRGEVGLIFAVVGKQLGVVDDHEFSVIVLMIMLTTLITPVVLAHLLRK